jgi:hypothetical protein
MLTEASVTKGHYDTRQRCQIHGGACARNVSSKFAAKLLGPGRPAVSAAAVY